MRHRSAAVMVAVGLLALPAVSHGGKDRSPGPHGRGGLGAVVARDSAKDNPAAAVARVTLASFGKVSYRILGNPKGTKMDWGITTRCVKGSLIDYFPGPGDFKTTRRAAPFGGTFPVPLKDPDSCTFAVAGQTFEHDAGRRVTVKIYNRG